MSYSICDKVGTFSRRCLPRKRVIQLGVLAALVSSGSRELSADESSPLIRPGASTVTPEPANVNEEVRGGMKTMGGRQFWGDLVYCHGWRIQRHVLTSHCRLIDPEDRRYDAGSLKKCRAALADVKRKLKLKPGSGEAVILVHGIIRSSKSFYKMDESLEKAGFAVVPFDYPSTQVSIEQAAEYLRSTVRSLEGYSRIHFVVHSMGGLVVRASIRKQPDPRIGRMVMIGVPNKGATMADKMKSNPLYRLLYGPAGQQLVSDPNGLIAELPTPQFEFAVVAGGRGTLEGFNPLVNGDDDGTVSVHNTRLPGAADFATVNCLHSFLMNNSSTIQMTVEFLNNGCLRKDGNRRPIVAEAGKARVTDMPSGGSESR